MKKIPSTKFQRGDCVVDFHGHTGVVVDVRTGTDDEDHGTITVWQAVRTSYGLDNCEHYAEAQCRTGTVLYLISPDDLFE